MYQLSIEHRPGRVHSNADALSRRPCVDCRHCDKSDTRYSKEEAPMADKGMNAHSMCLSSLPCSVGLGCVGAETSLDFSVNELESDRGPGPGTTLIDQHDIEQVMLVLHDVSATSAILRRPILVTFYDSHGDTEDTFSTLTPGGDPGVI